MPNQLPALASLYSFFVEHADAAAGCQVTSLCFLMTDIPGLSQVDLCSQCCTANLGLVQTSAYSDAYDDFATMYVTGVCNSTIADFESMVSVCNMP